MLQGETPDPTFLSKRAPRGLCADDGTEGDGPRTEEANMHDEDHSKYIDIDLSARRLPARDARPSVGADPVSGVDSSPDPWFWPASGVMWCAQHHGIIDEHGSYADECDMREPDSGPCDLRPMFYGQAEQVTP